MGLSEAQFRAVLDGRGILRPGALEAPPLRAAYAVFAQRPDAMLDLAATKAHAARFFEVKLGLTVDKSYDAHPPATDAAHIVVAGGDPTVSGTRLCFARAATPSDLSAAEEAERAQQTSGMALLARRCGMLWLVTQETADDRVSLMIAAILSSTLLGPILSPAGDALFGVRTARERLATVERPYR